MGPVLSHPNSPPVRRGTAGQPDAPGPVKGPARTHTQPPITSCYPGALPGGPRPSRHPARTVRLQQAVTTPLPQASPVLQAAQATGLQRPSLCNRWVRLHLPRKPGPRGLFTELATGQASDRQYQPGEFRRPHVTCDSKAPEPWVSLEAAPAAPRPGCLPTTRSEVPGGRKGKGEGTHSPGPQALQGQTLVQSLAQGQWQHGLGLVTSLSGSMSAGTKGTRAERAWSCVEEAVWPSLQHTVGAERTPPQWSSCSRAGTAPPPGHRQLTASRLHRPGPPPGPRGAERTVWAHEGEP